MKKINKHIEAEQLDTLRTKLHKRLVLEEVEQSCRQGLDQIIDLSKMDPVVFDRLWIQPLLAAGASIDVAYACIAESCLQPN